MVCCVFKININKIELLDDVAPRLLLGLEAALAELGGILLDNLLPLVELGPVHCLDVVDKVVKVLVLGCCPRVQSRQRSRCPDNRDDAGLQRIVNLLGHIVHVI